MTKNREVRRLRRRTTWSNRNFMILIFLSKSAQKIHPIFEKRLHFLIFHYQCWQISWKFFQLRGLDRPPPARTLHYSMSVLVPYFSHYYKIMAHRKNKKLSEKSAFFLEFSKIFLKFLLILMLIFEKSA